MRTNQVMCGTIFSSECDRMVGVVGVYAAHRCWTRSGSDEDEDSAMVLGSAGEI
jgi:hypothetical protein